MNIVRATPHPSGGAVTLRLALNDGDTPLLVATESPVPPSDPLQARILVEPETRLHEIPVEGVKLTNPTRHFRVFDFHKSLGMVQVYYWLYNRNNLTFVPNPVMVDARVPSMTTLVSHMRTLVTERLTYHVGRFLDTGKIKTPTDDIPILQQNALAQGDPLPCILLNETIVPQGSGIGKHRGDHTDPSGTYREYTHRGRSRIDILIISEKPGERNLLAKLLHEALLNDFTLFSDTGWQGVEPQLSMMSGVTQDGRLQMGESITIDGIVDYVRRIKIS